jgi:hypothetical protein
MRVAIAIERSNPENSGRGEMAMKERINQSQWYHDKLAEKDAEIERLKEAAKTKNAIIQLRNVEIERLKIICESKDDRIKVLASTISKWAPLITRAADALDTEPGEYPTIDALIQDLREATK